MFPAFGRCGSLFESVVIPDSDPRATVTSIPHPARESVDFEITFFKATTWIHFFAMDYTMEDTQNSAPDALEASKLNTTAQRNDTQSVTKRFVVDCPGISFLFLGI